MSCRSWKNHRFLCSSSLRLVSRNIACKEVYPHHFLSFCKGMFFCGIWVEIKNPTASVPKKISTISEKDCDDSCWSCWRNSHLSAHGIAKISSGFTVHQREAYSKLPRSCMEHLSRDLTIHLSSLLGSSSLRGHKIWALSENKLPFIGHPIPDAAPLVVSPVHRGYLLFPAGQPMWADHRPTHVYIYTYIYIYARVCVYIYIYVYTYNVYIYIDTYIYMLKIYPKEVLKLHRECFPPVKDHLRPCPRWPAGGQRWTELLSIGKRGKYCYFRLFHVNFWSCYADNSPRYLKIWSSHEFSKGKPQP